MLENLSVVCPQIIHLNLSFKIQNFESKRLFLPKLPAKKPLDLF